MMKEAPNSDGAFDVSGETVAKPIDQMEKRIGVRQDLPAAGQLGDGIEGAREEGERHHDEIRRRGDVVEFLRPEPDQHAQQRHQQRGREPVEQDRHRRRQVHRCQRHQGQRNGNSDHDAAGDAAERDTESELDRTQRRRQEVDDAALHFRQHDRGRGVGESVLHDRHHDEARQQEVEIGHAAQLPRAAAAQRQNEDGEEEQRRHHRRRDGLGDDLEEAPHLPHIERPETDPVDGAEASHAGRGGGRQEVCHGGGGTLRAPARPWQGLFGASCHWAAVPLSLG